MTWVLGLKKIEKHCNMQQWLVVCTNFWKVRSKKCTFSVCFCHPRGWFYFVNKDCSLPHDFATQESRLSYVNQLRGQFIVFLFPPNSFVCFANQEGTLACFSTIESWMRQKIHWPCSLCLPVSAEHQPKPEVNLPNHKTENGQTNVKER